ncbi:SCO7613 C-terminal domain-containing membrane protein [Microbacterium sp. A84]|uniref:SCO7613 C-terminal domain-containing membrane protein n=1 Tax=Microbacterium sp. A84 TaxID=3450715 RepID=UPI003F44425E
MSAATDTINWAEPVAQRLLDSTVCPVCASDNLKDGCCAHCGADLRGPVGIQVWNASISAAAALRARDALLSRVPRVVDAPATAPAPAIPQPTAPPAPPQTPPPTKPKPHPQPRSSATVQSVLAIAGAGLFAIAALIFTFLNPDLSDRAARSVVVGLVTLVFLGGAWMLARRGLQFSAEAVGALGLVFVAIDVYSFAQIGDTSAATWMLAALATAVASAVMLAAGRLSKIGVSRIRVWPWAALIGVAVVPAMLGYAAGAVYVSALGHIGTALLAAVLVRVWPPVAQRSLTAIQVAAVLSAVPLAVLGSFWFSGTVTIMLGISLVLALIAAHALFATHELLRHWWSLVAGASATTAFVLAVTSPVAHAAAEWMPAALPTAAAFAFALIAVSPLPRTVARSTLAIGGVIVVALIGLLPLTYAAVAAVDTLTDVVRGTGPLLSGEPGEWAPVLGMVGVAAGIALFGGLARDRDVQTQEHQNQDRQTQTQHQTLRPFAATTDVIAIGAAALAILTLACSNLLPLPARLIIVLASAAAAAIALRAIPSIRNTALVNRVVLIIGIHTAIAVGALISWLDPQSAPLSGLGVIAALALAAMALPAGIRFLHVGVGFAYALVCLGQALALTELGSIAVLCLVASAGLVGAIVVTFLPQVSSRNWYAVLVVTVVPFAAGIVQVIFERSGWTALSTALMFALALSLLLTRRPGLNIVLRTLAAGMLVPTVAVVVVCLGAQVLAISASPVTLPVIAAIVALVLPSTTLIRDSLRRNGLPADASAAVRVAIEASALLTGMIATALALAREAAGLGTTFLVLVILGIGAAASAVFTRRRYGWWVTGAAFTGALWCVWTMNGVDLLEAYLLPPALAAALIAAILAARGVEVRGLYAAGLGVAILPSIALLALIEPDARTAADVPWRAFALLAAGALLLGIGALLARLGRQLRRARLRMLVPATLAAAGLAAIAGPMQGIRMGIGADLTFLRGSTLFLACFGVSALAALILVFAGRGIRLAARAKSRLRTSRWIFAPAVLALAAGTWCAIERDWGSIWMMWMLMIGILAVMLTAAVRAERTTLPPVWFLFGVAFVTAVVAWSPRDLRVEWFSLPLGAFLLLGGIAGMRGIGGMRRHEGESGGMLGNWPAGRTGSWMLLAPGIITMMSASIVATFTDPLTWRAILVMVLALAAIMVGAGRRLAAPFIIGMLVLPIENVFVFSVQIGRGIESMPWWITLAVIGAVLLIIAVTYERRSEDASTVAARIRDLR